MIANILIACAYFALGFIVGGVFVLRSCWKTMQKSAKKFNEANRDPLIIRVYDAKH